MKRFLKYLYLILVTGVITFLLEYVSYRILMEQGLTGNHFVEARYLNRLSFWSGGLDNNEGYYFTGYNDSLELGDITFIDQLGFIHGDSLPLCLKKDTNTIRIVLTGGSGLFGSLQTWPLIKMFDYPQGTYDYKTSIAGKLKKNLEIKYPQIKWEVINAGVVLHTFVQSYARYLEKIKGVEPDIIINMDGSNDHFLINNFGEPSDPYSHTATQHEQALKSEILKRASKFGYTAMLVVHFFTTEIKTGLYDWLNKFLLLFFDREVFDLKQTVYSECKEKVEIVTDTLTPKGFDIILPYLKQNMKKQFWLIDAYMNQLSKDKVYAVYCFQPLLHRKGEQKSLSEKEKAMFDYFKYDKPQKIDIRGLDTRVAEAINSLGDNKEYIDKYINEHFINEYISPVTDSIVHQYGGTYIDLGKEMKFLDKNVEFYMDYTHTTPIGNQFIADKMMKGVEDYLVKVKGFVSDESR